jgi:ATP-dependent DNA ligase
MQNAGSNDAPIAFYAFDLLALEGRDLTSQPLSQGETFSESD